MALGAEAKMLLETSLFHIPVPGFKSATLPQPSFLCTRALGRQWMVEALELLLAAWDTRTQLPVQPYLSQASGEDLCVSASGLYLSS